MKSGDILVLRADEAEGFEEEVVRLLEIEANDVLLVEDVSGWPPKPFEVTKDQVKEVR